MPRLRDVAKEVGSEYVRTLVLPMTSASFKFRVKGI